jgi:hypothetical protein
LTNQEIGNGPSPPADQSQSNWIVFRIQKIERYFRDRHAATKEESPQDRASRRTANATVWIAALTLVVVFVGGLQYLIFRAQLKVMADQLIEMKGTGVQTDSLIEANKKLADAAQKQAEAAIVQAKAAQLMAEATRDIQIDSRLTIAPSLQSQVPNVKFFGPDQTATFMMFINNNGFARANQYRAWVKAEVREFPLNGVIATVIPQVSPTSLAKDGMSPELDAVTDAPIVRSDFEAVQRGEKAIYIFGEASYVDPYGSPGNYTIRYIYGRNGQGPLGFTAGDFLVMENQN